jgi:hypothetical protein
VDGCGAVEPAPVPQRPRDQLGPVVHPQMLRRAALAGEPVEHLADGVGVGAAADVHGGGLAGVLVDDGEQLEPPAVGGLVELEVQRPHVVRVLGVQPLGRVGPDPAALARCLWPAQSVLAPQAPDPIVVDRLPVAAQQPVRHPPAPPRMLSRDAA